MFLQGDEYKSDYCIVAKTTLAAVYIWKYLQ